MSDDANLESRTAQALRHYRAALAKVENLEREEASAHQALIEMLPDFGRAILEDSAPSLKDRLFETGSAAVSRSNVVECGELKEAVDADDARIKPLSLTPKGRRTLAALHDFGRQQVSGALERLSENERRIVRDGLVTYARALGASRGG
jgi:DNA-binding MarR family transcriptional regulator